MNVMTRRGFAAAVVVPVGALAIRAAWFAEPVAAQGPRGTRTTALQDPVLTQLHADIQELASEARANPTGRKASLRAIESLLAVEATHFGQHYDAGLSALLGQGVRTSGGADALVARLLQANPSAAYTPDQYRKGLDLLLEAPLSVWIRQTAGHLREIREKAPALALAGYRPAIYMNCSDLLRSIEHWTWVGGIIGMGALVEPGPFFEAGLLAVGTVIAGYQLAYWISC